MWAAWACVTRARGLSRISGQAQGRPQLRELEHGFLPGFATSKWCREASRFIYARSSTKLILRAEFLPLHGQGEACPPLPLPPPPLKEGQARRARAGLCPPLYYAISVDRNSLSFLMRQVFSWPRISCRCAEGTTIRPHEHGTPSWRERRFPAPTRSSG